jgi:hypothetical protein
MPQPCRLYYAWLLKCMKVTKEEALARVSKMGRACRPPLLPAECRDAVKSGYKRNWTGRIATTGKHALPSIRYQTVSDWLDITPQEAERLTKYPPASRFCLQERKLDPPRTGKRTMESRRAAICRIVAERAGVPSLREMAQLLTAEGYLVSQVTVGKDYKALGLQSNRAGGRTSQSFRSLFSESEHAVA